VVYGSLVPLNFNPRPLHEAWQTFQAMPYFWLGIGARAERVANILLFIPLSFLAAGAVDVNSAWRRAFGACQLLTQRESRRTRR
jgi:hypothetical protein